MSTFSTRVRVQMNSNSREPPRFSSALPIVGGGFAGLLAGADAILVAFLSAMLGGTTAPDLAVPGIGHAGWSAARGVEAGLDLGGVVIVLGLTVLGAFAGWSLQRARGPGHRSLATA